MQPYQHAHPIRHLAHALRRKLGILALAGVAGFGGCSQAPDPDALELEERGGFLEGENLSIEELAQEVVTSGCGMPLNTSWLKPYTLSWGGKTRRGTVVAAGKTREYVIELPSNYDPDLPRPIVFAFHGMGATMDAGYGTNAHKIWPQAIVVYPQALAVNGKTSWQFAVNGFDQKFFEAMMTDLGKRLCIDMDQVYLQGHSRGAMMSNFISCVRGDIVDGGAPAAGAFLVNPSACKGAVPQFIINGKADPTVSFASGALSRDRWIALNKCSNVGKTYGPEPRCVIYDQCTSKKPVVWCPHEGGHSSAKALKLDVDVKPFFEKY